MALLNTISYVVSFQSRTAGTIILFNLIVLNTFFESRPNYEQKRFAHFLTAVFLAFERHGSERNLHSAAIINSGKSRSFISFSYK